MITKITGKLLPVAEDVATLRIGAFEYEVLIPEFTRRQLQHRVGEEISLHTIDYLEGNPMQGRMTPRLIGFLSEVEREFFELFCSVDGVGVKKALRAMVRPVREVATAIEEQDAKVLSSLPGVGPATGRADHRQAAAQGAQVRAAGRPRRSVRDDRRARSGAGDVRGAAQAGPLRERRPPTARRGSGRQEEICRRASPAAGDLPAAAGKS